VLRNLPETSVLSRMPALELLVRARAAEGRPEAVEAECEQLQWSGAELGTPYLVGRARLAAAELAAARGDYEGARRAAEDAIDRFTEGSAPYDCGLARLEEAKAAKETFDKLGAARDGARAERLIAGGSGDRDGGEASLSELTPRELEVLRLVAQGMSDAEIAEHLVVSPHTVHRHVANVRVKLRLPSRAAAVAYAARAGLL
jgi:DNA-binding CsgD family transcriptional regulator